MAKQVSTSQILKRRARKQQRGILTRIIKWALITVVILMVFGAAATVGVFYYFSRGLPKITSLTDYRPSIISTVYSDDNKIIAEFAAERRIVVPLEKIPLKLQQAFISAEDDRFYKHQGIDIFSIIRAFIKNIEAGTVVQGGSTITQQVTKSFLLTPERSYKRKIREAMLAYQIDRDFSKDDILYLYLNQIYLGHGAYGVQAASENYFGKNVEDLNLAECAILAGLPQAPSRYTPFHHPERAKQRQIYVLNRMVAEGYITDVEASEAINTVMDIKPRQNLFLEQVPVFTEHIRRYVVNKYGEDALMTQGMKIYAAVNVDMQKAAVEAVQKGLKELDQREGYNGPLEQLAPDQIETFSNELELKINDAPLSAGQTSKAVVIDVDNKAEKVTVRMGKERGIIAFKTMRWARVPDPKVAYFNGRIQRPGQALSVGDVILVSLQSKDEGSGLWTVELDQVPAVQSALMCLEAGTGLVKVMVGGRDFSESQFNRALQSRRQPGSAFKPITYACALDHGYTPASVIIDSPIVLRDEDRDFTWKPENYKHEFYGPTLMREALAKSRNVVTIKIMQDIGVGTVIDYARKLGIESDLSRDLTLALGSSGVSLFEIVKAYSVFANQGFLVEPAFVTKIEDRYGNILEEMSPSRNQVIEKSTAYIMTSLMEGVVKNGTGRRVKALNRPVAGKTGTSNNLNDAWFVGYTPRFIAGVWAGYDQERAMGIGEGGARTASPIWLDFMQQVMKNEPVRVFQVPEGVVFAKIDAKTGLLPIPESEKTIFECFKEGTVPTEHTPKPGAIVDPEQFFKKDI